MPHGSLSDETFFSISKKKKKKNETKRKNEKRDIQREGDILNLVFPLFVIISAGILKLYLSTVSCDKKSGRNQ